MDQLPLTWTQRAIAVAAQAAPARWWNYVMVPVGDAPRHQVAQALRHAVDRHDALRIQLSYSGPRRLQSDGAEPELAIVHNPEVRTAIEVEDTGQLAGSQDRWDLLARELDLCANAEDTPLCKAALFETGGDRILLVAVSHVVFDQVSTDILRGELELLLAGRGHELAPLPRNGFLDYVAAEHELLASPASGPLLDYWHEQLDDLPRSPFVRWAVPLDASRIADGDGFDTVEFGMGPRHAALFRRAAAAARVTPFQFFLAAFYVTLHLVTEERDLWVTTPSDRRRTALLRQMPGCIFTLPVMRQRIAPDDTLHDVLRTTRTLVGTTLAKDVIGFIALVPELPSDAKLSLLRGSVRFGVNDSGRSLALPPPGDDHRDEPLRIDITSGWRGSEALFYVDIGDRLTGLLACPRLNREAAYLESFVRTFRTVAESMAHRPGATVGSLVEAAGTADAVGSVDVDVDASARRRQVVATATA